MKMLRQSLWVGALTLFGVVGSVFFMHTVKKGISGGYYNIFALLPDADGLYNKSRVMVAGIVVGEIAQIRLEGEKARIDLRIRRNVPLYQDAAIAKVSTGLLGDYALILRRGIPKTGHIPEGGQIKHIFQEGLLSQVGQATPSIMKLTKALGDLSEGAESQGRGSLRDIAESLRQLTKALSHSVESNQARVGDIIKSTQDITKNLSQLTGKNIRYINKIIQDVRSITQNIKRASNQEQNLRAILQDVRDLTRSFKEIVKNQISPGANTLRETLHKLDKTAGQVKEISEKVNTGQGTIGRLVNDKKLIDKVEEVVIDVNKLVKRISILQTDVHWRIDYYALRGRFRNEVGVTLIPSPNKYYSITLIDDPRGVATFNRTIRRTTDPNQPALVNEEETRIADSFRFSAQIHLRWWFAALRGGIIENSGGAGLDLYFFNDILKIKTDLFEFSLETLPRLRVLASLQLWRFTLTIGGDDLLNGTRDFFFGAGIAFTDKDLKYILPFLGGIR